MTTRRAFLAAAGSLAVAGCATRGDEDAASPTATPTDDPSSPTDGTSTGPGTTVSYRLRSGPVPDAFASATATVRAVVVENERDLGPCYPEIYEGPYKPTITPIATPSGTCHAADPVEVDLAATDERTIEATAPAAASGHALVATRLVGTDRDGDDVTAIKGTGGVRLLEEASPPTGVYGVEMGIDSAPETADYDYRVTTARVDPDT